MRDLIENRARLTDPARLNRMLLEAAFPGKFATGVSGDSFLRVLFVMREDYVAGLEPYLGVLPEKLRARYRLERLSPDQALQAVIRPLEHASPRRAFAPGVADQLVKDLIEVEVQTPGTPDYRVVVPPAKPRFRRRVIGGASLKAFELVTTWLLARTGPVQIDADAVGPDDVRALIAAAWQTLSQSDFEIKDARLTGNGRLERSFGEFARAPRSAVQERWTAGATPPTPGKGTGRRGEEDAPRPRACDGRRAVRRAGSARRGLRGDLERVDAGCDRNYSRTSEEVRRRQSRPLIVLRKMCPRCRQAVGYHGRQVARLVRACG